MGKDWLILVKNSDPNNLVLSFVYFTLPAVYKVKLLFILLLIRRTKIGNVLKKDITESNKSSLFSILGNF